MKNFIKQQIENGPKTWAELERVMETKFQVHGHTGLSGDDGVYWDGLSFPVCRAIRELIADGEAKIIPSDLQLYVAQDSRIPRGFVPTVLVATVPSPR
jgi:hypothetical protein